MDIKIISNAIKNHGGKEESNYDNIISICLIIADKLDFINTSKEACGVYDYLIFSGGDGSFNLIVNLPNNINYSQ